MGYRYESVSIINHISCDVRRMKMYYSIAKPVYWLYFVNEARVRGGQKLDFRSRNTLNSLNV